ncbi:MAG: DUF1549 domain-containing protein [Verrucomicrobiales bacterium]
MNPPTILTSALATILIAGTACAEIDFAHEVLPILNAHCIECHSNGKYKGGFSLDTREAVLESEAVIVGNAEESHLAKLLVAADPDDRMPQRADALTAEQVTVLRRWIDEGVAWEPGFTFREKTWTPPLAPRRPDLPPALPEGENPIDRIVRAYFEANQIDPPAPISDASFLRRAYLDLLGVLPPIDELQAFGNASSPQGKRGKKVAELLGRQIDYADHWMTFWNDLLRNDYAGTGFIDGGRKQITGWLYQALLDNRPYDQFVRELMAPTTESEGFINGIKWRGNVNASQVQEVQYAQNVAQVFFGENLKCASCHDSFINDWKLEDAYGMAAIFAGKPLEMFRCDKPTGEFANPKFLFDSLGEIEASAPRAERLQRAAELSTTNGNGRLARTIVNRLWARLMGRGLVEPVDIMGNRPWSEDLLDFLAWDLAENGYDLKHTLALIASSRIYQSSITSPPAEAETFVFHGPIAKRMSAEQFIDAVWGMTGSTPTKVDAAVRRGNPGGDLDVPESWIWSAAGDRPAGEQVVFTREFDLAPPASAMLLATCDNAYELSINGEPIGGGDDWEKLEAFDVSDRLKVGGNSIRISAKNLGGSPNPAALFVYLRVVSPGQEPFVLSSDKHWLADGEPAVELGAGPWGERIRAQLAGHLASAAAAPSEELPSVRASLMKSTLLMRALGRPNREQVVTTRPAELTTLQALELNNGAEFAGYLDRGAATLLKRGDGLINYLYLRALSRQPLDSERAVAQQITGTPATKEGVADLLWTLLMLPEFQIVN